MAVFDRQKTAGVALSAETLDRSYPRHAQPGSFLNENLGAINVELTSADLRDIEAAFSGITVHGGRMNPMQLEFVDQSV